MLRYHVSCGSSKKVVSIEDGTTTEQLNEKLNEVLEVNIDVVQVYSEEWEDWVDLDNEIPADKSKLRIIVKDENQELQKTQHPVDPGVLTEKVAIHVPEQHQNSVWHLNYQVPQMPPEVRQYLSDNDKAVWSRRNRSKIIQVLYQDVVKHTLYPSSLEYNEVARALVRKYPVLRDKACNASGHDTWKTALRNKFKHERAPLVDEGVAKQKLLYGHKRVLPDHTKLPSPIKRTKRDLVEQQMQMGEDEASLRKHIEDLKILAARSRPDMDSIADKLTRTALYRRQLIGEKSLACVLEEFPILKSDVQLLNEIQTTFHCKDVKKGLLKLVQDGGPEILKEAAGLAACKMLHNLYYEEREKATSEKEKQDLLVAACCLLIPLVLGEKDQAYVIDKEPILPTPTLVIKGNPFRTDDIRIHMDGVTVCTNTTILAGLAATFACFYVFGVEYPRYGKKTMLLFQQYLAGLDCAKALPSRVQRFVNNVTH